MRQRILACIRDLGRALVEFADSRDGVFSCRYCHRRVDYLKPYHSDADGFWHWECGK